MAYPKILNRQKFMFSANMVIHLIHLKSRAFSYTAHVSLAVVGKWSHCAELSFVRTFLLFDLYRHILCALVFVYVLVLLFHVVY